MYGVILWSDPDVRKAVIWCEDQGYLAYYEAPEETRNLPQEFFDAGDYIEFEMTDDVAPRRACNAQMLRSARCPRVARTLHSSGGMPAKPVGTTGRVIDLTDRLPTDINRRG
jgi:hypothetical protein